MNKNYTATPMLDEILNKKEKRARKKLNIELSGCGIIGMYMTIQCIKCSSGIADIFACWVLSAIIAGCFWWGYYTAVKIKENIKSQLSLYSDDTLENIIQNGEKLDEYVYLSDEYIIDFNYAQAVKLSEVCSVSKYFQFEVRGKMIVIYSDKRERQFFLFKTKQKRDDAIVKINIAVCRAKKKTESPDGKDLILDL